MTKKTTDAKALKVAKKLHNADNWKHLARWNGKGYLTLETENIGAVSMKLFLAPSLV